jgi:hypothetical protein
MRVLLAGLLDAVVLVPSVFLAVHIDTILRLLAFGLLPSLVTAWLAPLVSYRRRDALWSLILWGWPFGILAWRVAYLPYRDWPPRPDEKPQARWLREPTHAGTWTLENQGPS